jgi:hypothetical protein
VTDACIIDRMPGESVSDYARRMSDLINLIAGIVHAEAGMMIDLDDVIKEFDFIDEHAGDPAWQECWDLRQEIDRVVSRMLSPTRLQRVLFFAEEMSR